VTVARVRTLAFVLLVGVTGVAAMACGSAPRKPVGISPEARDAPPKKIAPKGNAASPKPFPSHVVALVPDRTLGPFLARRGTNALAAYVEGGEQGGRRLVTVALDDGGKPKGKPRMIGAAPGETNALVVRATGGERAGFVAALTALTDRGGESLTVFGIADDGTSRAPGAELARTTEDIVWTEIVPTARGAICFWAEETRAKAANILAVSLDPDGKPRGVPSHVAKGVTGWQAIPTTMGVALALVTPAGAPAAAPAAALAAAPAAAHAAGSATTPAAAHAAGSATTPAPAAAPAAARAAAPAADDPKKLGSLSLLKLDAEGRAIGAAVTVSPTPTVGSDFEIVTAGDGLLLAWTDRSGLDPEVTVAAVDAAGAARPPVRPVSPVGGSSLVALASGKAGTALAWDEPSKRARPTRRVHLAIIAPGGAAAAAPAAAAGANGNATSAGVAIEVQGSAPPELVATEDGFALLAPARSCALTDTPDACAASVPLPTFVRLDAKLAVVQTEALRLLDASSTVGDASLAWSLDCARNRCIALAAPNQSPAPIHAVDLVKRTSAYRSPLIPAPPADAARGTALATLAVGDVYADLAVVKVGDTSLLALVTAAADDRATTKKGPGGASLTVRALDAAGIPQAPTTITPRALTVGGVAMAAGATPEDGAAIAWVAREGGDPQVHVTKVDRRGKKTGDVLVTTDKGDASDVAIAQVSGGFIVAWVDGRDGNGEVYAAKVSNDLRVSAHERVTKAPGDASDLVILPTKDAVWLAWADPRESPHDGFADVFVVPLDPATAKRSGEEARVLPTAAHSRSPVLASTSSGLVIAWIEDAPLASDQGNASHGAMIAWLDPKGRPIKDPIRTRGAANGAPTAITLDVSPSGALRGILARGTRDELVLDAIDLSPTAPPRAYPLLSMIGPPSFDVSLKLLGEALYYSDGGSEADDNRARRLTLVWK
jgi:hypothetical protein